jgi:hypothetical protein
MSNPVRWVIRSQQGRHQTPHRRRYKFMLIQGLPFWRQVLYGKSLQLTIHGDNFGLEKFRLRAPTNARTCAIIQLDVLYEPLTGKALSYDILQNDQWVGGTDLDVSGIFHWRIPGEPIDPPGCTVRIDENHLHVEMETGGRFGALITGGALGGFGGSTISAVLSNVESVVSILRPMTSSVTSAISGLAPILENLALANPTLFAALAGLLGGATAGMAIAHNVVWAPHAKATIRVPLYDNGSSEIEVLATGWPNAYVYVFRQAFSGALLYTLWRGRTSLPPSSYGRPLDWTLELRKGMGPRDGEQIDGEITQFDGDDEDVEIDVSSTKVNEWSKK